MSALVTKRSLRAVPVSDVQTVRVGGRNDPAFGGGPLDPTGKVRCVSDGVLVGSGPTIGGQTFRFGTSAVLRVEGVDILVVPERGQMLDLEQFHAFGIGPAPRRVVALKSMQHVRAAFEPITGRIVVCDSGALSTPDM